jgi:hypothetical protein
MTISRAYGQKPAKKKRAGLGLRMLAALVMSLLFTRHATRHGEAEPVLEPRAARLEDLDRNDIGADRYALVASLWADYAVPSCRVATVWGNSAAGASFSPTLRLSMKASVRAPVVPSNACAWVAPASLDLTAANDAVAREVSMVPGAAPVVRIGRFRKHRAAFSAGAFAAGGGLRLAA